MQVSLLPHSLLYLARSLSCHRHCHSCLPTPPLPAWDTPGHSFAISCFSGIKKLPQSQQVAEKTSGLIATSTRIRLQSWCTAFPGKSKASQNAMLRREEHRRLLKHFALSAVHMKLLQGKHAIPPPTPPPCLALYSPGWKPPEKRHNSHPSPDSLT